MNSVAEAFGSSCLGVIMTGMGRDGPTAADNPRRGRVRPGQNEATSDVYGMNKVPSSKGTSTASSPRRGRTVIMQTSGVCGSRRRRLTTCRTTYGFLECGPSGSSGPNNNKVIP